ncbi:ester cyclase [Streptomyces albireticuli]|uniref:Ester cyclase n=1 Tax=Streptomyces albireticuli TaxID=1940 RepID=A0A1Z2KZ92_9ACTN|nr:ester cyclase [Streptomyces albireticuli]ARZ67261.1 ester cyclase [Streptomyces albireticuli]
MQADHGKLAADFVTMVNERHADAVDDLLIDDYIDHNPLIGNGREANRAFWTDFFTAFPDITVTAEDVIVSGDRLVGRFSYRGTHKGPFAGIPATGVEVHMRTIDIWRVEDGRLAEHWDEINLYELLQQVGAVPPLAPYEAR